jgi:transposase
MDKRMKYSLKEKMLVVRSILSGRESVNSAAIKKGAHRKTIQCWVSLYKYHGKAGLKDKPGYYSERFKMKVINHMLKNHLSLIETAAFFGIPTDYTVRNWFKRYEQEGQRGLLQKRRGRKRSMMSKKPRKGKQTSTGTVEERLAALQAENEYLRAENAFLKKLDALVQEQKAAQKQSRQQKPSRN